MYMYDQLRFLYCSWLLSICITHTMTDSLNILSEMPHFCIGYKRDIETQNLYEIHDTTLK